MPYFIDRENRVVITLTGEKDPPGARWLDPAVGNALRLHHGDGLSPTRVACALAGDIDGYHAATDEYVKPDPTLEPPQPSILAARPAAASAPMLMSTTPFLDGWEITEILGMVTGNTIRVRNLASRTGAGLKSIVGGELGGLVKALNTSRDEAIQRMVTAARELQATAIVGVSFSTSDVLDAASEILVAGTAVKAIRRPKPDAS